VALFEGDQRRIQEQGRKTGSALRVHQVLKARPITSLQEVTERTGISFPTASSSMDLLGNLGVVKELTGGRRNRLFAYQDYLTILNEGTEPL
jgi:Fic family protein